jgi:hypothetical protein
MVFYKAFSMAILAGATAVASVQPTAAAPLMINADIQSAASNVENVQYRRWHRGHRHHHGWGGAAALGGLAAGAVIGGAIANSQAQAADAHAYCSQRFQSYDPASGTYLSRDGSRRPCP